MLLILADRFFCPALEVLADYFKLPENVAGATLLSFGNGAPDLFTQLAAVLQKDSSAIPMAIGEPLGGGMFASNIVVALVVLLCGTPLLKIEKAAFLRDASFYCGGVCILIAVAWDSVVRHAQRTLLLRVH